ncbi:MAG: mitochondrial import inner membrane translocase subunit tim10 [Piptocephalis tieghemiana]|nr:MAG: mitochondrial import inner membrane translocase subunit tim10 [Piptocephalis tieghemiana]
MSFFGGNPSNGPYGLSRGNQSVDEAKIAMAEQQMNMFTDIFERMSSLCQAKCISTKYTDSDLTKGESVCTDRCVSKYFQVGTMIDKKFVAKSEAEAAMRPS